MKEELLRVMLASNPDGAPVSLLQQCFTWLVQVYTKRFTIWHFRISPGHYCPIE